MDLTLVSYKNQSSAVNRQTGKRHKSGTRIRQNSEVKLTHGPELKTKEGSETRLRHGPD